MSYYCEKCQSVCGQEVCGFCGNKKLRAPENNDFCFLIETDSMFGGMLESILKEESIPCGVVPVGNGVRSCFALKLENCRIYVPFEFLTAAKNLLDDLTSGFEEEQKNELINNIDRLHASAGNEKKLKKNLKLTEAQSLIDYCADKIMHAERVIDKGRITGCLQGGNYLFVYTDDEMFTINSATFEIISANKAR